MTRNFSKYNDEKSNMKSYNCDRDSQNNKNFARVFWMNIARSLQHCKSKKLSYSQLPLTTTIPSIWSFTPGYQFAFNPKQSNDRNSPNHYTSHWAHFRKTGQVSSMNKWLILVYLALFKDEIFQKFLEWKYQNEFKKGTYSFKKGNFIL